MKIIRYIVYKIKSLFKHRITKSYSTRKHQYFNAWIGKEWYEKI
jgi:hypothetical protein